MKKFMVGVVFFATSAVFLAQAPEKTQTKPSYPHYHAWALTITPKTQKAYIDSVADVWKKDSIDLKFSRLEYNSDHQLVKIKGTVSITVQGNKATEKFDYTNLKWCKIVVNNTPKVTITEN